MVTDPSRKKPQDDVVGRTSEHHFVSYSRHGDSAFVKELKDALQRGQPRFKVWMDQSEMGPGQWPMQLEKAIDNCGSFLLVVSEETNTSTVCAQELARACNNGKVVIPLIRDCKVPKPLLAQNYEHVDFSRDFKDGLEKLRQFLKKLAPPGSMERTPVTTGLVVINDPPLIAPTYFQGRDKLGRTIEEFLSDDVRALLWISGRAGSGKTGLACRVLERLRLGGWADPDRRVDINAIAYVGQKQQSRSDWRNLFNELRQLIAVRGTEESQNLQQGCFPTFEVQNLLTALADQRIILLIDHLDDLIDFKTRTMRGQYMKDVLQAVLTVTTHRLKVIVTSRMHPLDFSKGYEWRWLSLDLGNGLPQAEAMQLLETLARDRTAGLRDSDEIRLAEISRRTQGNPGAIEVFHALLRDNLNISFKKTLDDDSRFLPREVLNVLVGESYACLDDVSKTIMQLLLMSEAAVTADAVVSVFHHYYPKSDHPTINPQQVLKQLVNMQLVKNTDEGYSLSDADRCYVASQLADGMSPVMSGSEGVHLDRSVLLTLYVEYMQQAGAGSLTRRLEEFQLRYKKKDYAAAVDILKGLETLLWEQGRYKKLAQCYKRLAGKLEDPKLVRRQFDTLARIYHQLGKLPKAAYYYEKGLTCVRDAHDLTGECRYLANLAICKQESGDLVETTLYCMAALELAQQTGASALEAHIWTIISETLSSLGQISDAIEASERALKLAQDKFEAQIKVVALFNLGEYFHALDEISRAQEACSQAFDISKERGFQLGRSAAKRNLGILKLCGPLYTLSPDDFIEAKLLADVTQSVQLQQTTRIELATALLRNDKLSDAEATIDEAVRYDTPLFSPQAYALRGVILQRCGKVREAAESFRKALEKSSMVLQRAPRYYRALDAMGLSYSGLTLSEQADEYLDEAIGAYGAAHDITSEQGIVCRRLLLFDALAKDDSEKKLALVRNAITPAP